MAPCDNDPRHESKAGLPDGKFYMYQKSQFECFWEGLGMENVGIFYGHLKYLLATWNISLPFGLFFGHLVCFSPFWYIVPRKIWQP
jgi:hypothetical protein